MTSPATTLPSPNTDADAVKLMGLGLQFFKAGHLQEAQQAFKTLLVSNPSLPQAQLMMGLVEHKLANLASAKHHLEQALEQQPDNFSALNALANVLFDLKAFDEAEPLFDRVVEMKPDQGDAYHRLSIIHYQKGNIDHAITLLLDIIKKHPDNSFYWTALQEICLNHKAIVPSQELCEMLNRTLSIGTQASDQAMAIAVAMAFKVEPCRHLPIFSTLPQDPLWFEASMLPYLNHSLLRTTIQTKFIASVEYEHFLTGVRRFLLTHAEELTTLVEQHPFLNEFVSELAIHSMLSDFAHFISDEEKERLEPLWDNINSTSSFIEQNIPIISLLGCYRPLYKLSCAQAILDSLRHTSNRSFSQLLTAQIREPLEEFSIMETIPALQEIKDEVSQKVAAQYMEHPYPRWRAQPAYQPAELNTLLLQHYPWLRPQMPILPTNRPVQLLVAGCGTGDHALACAMGYHNVEVTAIDITKASLAYAIRKTRELNVKNVSYMQADILDLDQMDKEFDAIECCGVLHHMRDPVEGWKKLKTRLKPGGLMKIGLYSETARRAIVKAREEIQSLGYAADDDGIRAFRQYVISLPKDAPLRHAIIARDFYNLAECRDLLFHVQEHRFTIPQIKDIIGELNLPFIGMIYRDAHSLSAFKKQFPALEDQQSLDNWHQFEQENLDAFKGMYQFWLQKPSIAQIVRHGHN